MSKHARVTLVDIEDSSVVAHVVSGDVTLVLRDSGTPRMLPGGLVALLLATKSAKVVGTDLEALFDLLPRIRVEAHQKDGSALDVIPSFEDAIIFDFAHNFLGGLLDKWEAEKN